MSKYNCPECVVEVYELDPKYGYKDEYLCIMCGKIWTIKEKEQ